MIKDIVVSFLKDSIKKIEHDECSLSDQELQHLASNIIHIKINKTEAAEILGISTRTLDRKINLGEVPAGRKDLGSNSLYWYKDELLNL